MNSITSGDLRKEGMILGGFVAFSLLLRFFSFFPTSISHDESTFFVIAREIFQEKVYFVDLVDTKPIGIYLIFGLFIRFVSSSIFMIRFFMALVVSLTAYVIYRINLRDMGERKPAIAGGMIFILLLSTFAYFGVFVNPELLYILFTACAFLIFIRTEKPVGFFLLGLLLGIGFIIKYVVLFDLAAWLLFYFGMAVLSKEKSRISKTFVNCLIACLAFLIPFGAVVLYYYGIGHLNEFWYYTFGVTSRIPVERSIVDTVIYIGDFHLRFLPVVFFFYYILTKGKDLPSKTSMNHQLIVLWCLLILIAVLLPGKPFGHYFIQMMLPVSILAGRIFSRHVILPHWLSVLTSRPVGPVILGTFIITLLIIQKRDYYDHPDLHQQVADYLEPKLSPDDMIYTGNANQVLYYLLEKDCPIKYVHRTLICDVEHRQALEINLEEEMESMMATDFRYIIMQGSYCYEPMNMHIEKHYRELKKFSEDVVVFERIAEQLTENQ